MERDEDDPRAAAFIDRVKKELGDGVYVQWETNGRAYAFTLRYDGVPKFHRLDPGRRPEAEAERWCRELVRGRG